MDNNFILKANLFEHGINVDATAKKLLDKLSDIWLMDDYITCSGVTLVYNDTYVTSGVDQNSKYKLIAKDNHFYIVDVSNTEIPCTVITPPDYMKDELIVEGEKITTYVNTYTDRVRIQLMSGCANRCKFCNATEFRYYLNSLKGIEEALKIALSQSEVRHALISSGSVRVNDLEKLTEMYRYFGQKYSHLDIDVMMTPRGFTSYTDSTQYEDYIKYLKESGIKGLSINMELNSLTALQRFCPEKALIGQENYLKFLKSSVEIFGKNKVRSLLIVGLEPLEETLKGVEKLAKIGCNPVLSPLFPYGEANFPPKADLFIEARKRSEEICAKYDIELGPLCKPCSHNTL